MATNIERFDGEYQFLSNSWPCAIVFKELYYPSAEHALQAAKTLDGSQSYRIRKARSVDVAKRRGQTVRVRSDWNVVRVPILKQILRYKFGTPLRRLHRLGPTQRPG